MRYLFALCLALVSAFAHAGPYAKNLDNIALVWTPTSDVSTLSAMQLAAVEGKVQIEKFKDARKPDLKNKVGENLEGQAKGTVLPVTTKSDIAGFVTENFKDTVKKAGLSVVDSGGDYVISGELNEFFVKEVDTYSALMGAKITLTKGGKVLWKGVVVGSNKRFGRSFKLENYLECFSDVIIDFAEKLFQNNDFKSQLK